MIIYKGDKKSLADRTMFFPCLNSIMLDKNTQMENNLLYSAFYCHLVKRKTKKIQNSENIQNGIVAEDFF